jgi:RecJ-like exonuclease
MSQSINPNQPQCLTPEQSQLINLNPKVRELLRKQDLLKSRNLDKEHFVKINRDVRNKKQRLRHKLLQQLRTEYNREQAKRDIQLQLKGLKFSETIKANLRKSLN